MKRAAIVCLLFALPAASLAAPAAANKRTKKITREAVITYRYPAVGSPSTRAACLPCPTFQISPTERWVTMEVVDDASLAPVAFSIFQNADGNEAVFETVGGPFCGSTDEPVEVAPGEEVGFTVYAFGDVVCPGAVGTSGTVTAVFSNLP